MILGKNLCLTLDLQESLVPKAGELMGIVSNYLCMCCPKWQLWSLGAAAYLRCGWSELRRAIRVKYTPDFDDLDTLYSFFQGH